MSSPTRAQSSPVGRLCPIIEQDHILGSYNSLNAPLFDAAHYSSQQYQNIQNNYHHPHYTTSQPNPFFDEPASRSVSHALAASIDQHEQLIMQHSLGTQSQFYASEPPRSPSPNRGINRATGKESPSKETIREIRRHAPSQTLASQDIYSLVKELETLKLVNNEKSLDLAHLDALRRANCQQFHVTVEHLTQENVLLRSRLLDQKIKKDGQLQQAEVKKQLERSRAKGLMELCKQSTSFLEAQIKRLTAEQTQKNTQVQHLNHQLMKVMTLYESSQHSFKNKVDAMNNGHADEVRQLKQAMSDIERQKNGQIAQLSKVNGDLAAKLTAMEERYQLLSRELIAAREQLDRRTAEIGQLQSLQDKYPEDQNYILPRTKTETRSIKSGLNNLLSEDNEDLQRQHLPTPQLNMSATRQLSSVMHHHNMEVSGLSRSQQPQYRDQDHNVRDNRDQDHYAREYTHQSKDSFSYSFGPQITNSLQLPKQTFTPSLTTVTQSHRLMIQEIQAAHERQIKLLEIKLEDMENKLNDKQTQLLDVLQKIAPLAHQKRGNVYQQLMFENTDHSKSMTAGKGESVITKVGRQNVQRGLLSIMLDKYGIIGVNTEISRQ